MGEHRGWITTNKQLPYLSNKTSYRVSDPNRLTKENHGKLNNKIRKIKRHSTSNPDPNYFKYK